MKKQKSNLALNKPTDRAYLRIKEILDAARSNTYRAVNFAMVQAYWSIGRVIVEEEQKGKSRAEYGSGLIQKLSEKLLKDFGQGFDKSNLWYMRQFYLVFPILDALPRELSWTHCRLLIKIDDPKSRDFYVKECIEGHWSTRQLERQINSFYFERLLSSRDKKVVKKEVFSKEPSISSKDLIKDPYVLEFLDLKENRNYLEKDLEQALINKLQDFLLELGKGFSFVGRQHRLTVDGQHFYIDLVFYNYILKCFVLLDLKIGKLTHADIGQMDFYVRYFEKEIRNKEDNPTIGLILCSEKSNAMVKYTLLDKNKRVFASKYKIYLPTELELKAELSRERSLLESELKLKEA